MLADSFERFLLRELLDVFSLLNCACAADHGVQERFQLRLAVLRFENLDAQVHGCHGWIISSGNLGGALIN